MKHLAVAILALTLAACSLSPKPVVTPPPKPHLAKPSLTSMAECNDPVDPREGPATQKQVEALWGIDTDSLIDCSKRHHILVTYVRNRDAALAGN